MSEYIAVALRELAEPSPRGERIKEVIDRVAGLCSLDYWRVYEMWYGRARRIEDFEFDAIADAVEAKRLKAAQNEYADLRARMARLETLIGRIDSAASRTRVDAVRHEVRSGHGKDRPMARSGDRLAELMGAAAPAWGRA